MECKTHDWTSDVFIIAGDDSMLRTSFSDVYIFDNCCLIQAH